MVHEGALTNTGSSLQYDDPSGMLDPDPDFCKMLNFFINKIFFLPFLLINNIYLYLVVNWGSRDR